MYFSLKSAIFSHFLGSKNNVGPCPDVKSNKNINSSHSLYGEV